MQFYGQDISYDSWFMARLNMHLHQLTRRVWPSQQLSPDARLTIAHLTSSAQKPQAGLFSPVQQKHLASPEREREGAMPLPLPDPWIPPPHKPLSEGGLLYVTVQPPFPLKRQADRRRMSTNRETFRTCGDGREPMTARNNSGWAYTNEPLLATTHTSTFGLRQPRRGVAQYGDKSDTYG